MARQGSSLGDVDDDDKTTITTCTSATFRRTNVSPSKKMATQCQTFMFDTIAAWEQSMHRDHSDFLLNERGLLVEQARFRGLVREASKLSEDEIVGKFEDSRLMRLSMEQICEPPEEHRDAPFVSLWTTSDNNNKAECCFCSGPAMLAWIRPRVLSLFWARHRAGPNAYEPIETQQGSSDTDLPHAPSNDE